MIDFTDMLIELMVLLNLGDSDSVPIGAVGPIETTRLRRTFVRDN